jgi:HlyD family secretion protein
VQPTQSVNVSPKTSGILKQLLVKEGDRVKSGQILAYMDDSNLQGELTQAEAQLANAQANLDRLVAGNRPQDIAQARAQMESAQANLDRLVAGNRSQDIAQANAQLQNVQATLRQAELTYSRNQQLYNEGAISRQDLDNARTALDSARAQVNSAQQALSLQQAGTRPEEIAQARAQLASAQEAYSLQQAGSRAEDIAQARAQVTSAGGALQTIQARLNDTVIRAPFDGLITRVFADPGAFVTPTTTSSSEASATSSSILALASRNEVVAKIPEASIAQIKVGQTVEIKADAYPGQAFKGKVTQVATQSTVEQSVTNFEVKMSLEDPKNQLRSGMNTDVDFKVGLLEGVLVVPTVAIVRQEQGTGVYVVGSGEGRRAPRFQPITTGVTVGDRTVVTEGLQEGDRVLLSFPQGQRPASRTPSIFPGMGGPGGGGGGGGGGRSGGSRPGSP